MTDHAAHGVQHATFKLDDIYCVECAEAIEQALRGQPHITSVHLDWTSNQVHVGYHAGMISAEAIERVIASTGCACAPADGTHEHAGHVQPSNTRRLQRLQHAVDVRR